MEVEITDAQIDVIAGIAYSQVFTARSCRPLRMTVMIPRTGDPKPAVVYFPGGGFVTCDYEKFVQMRLALVKAGFVVAAAEYRTVPDKYPAPVIDGKAAVRFLRAHASLLEIDPARIGVLGDSSGGYLAQLTLLCLRSKAPGSTRHCLRKAMMSLTSLLRAPDMEIFSGISRSS